MKHFCTLKDSRMQICTLRGAKITGADLHSERGTNIRVQTCTLTCANLSWLHIYGCRFAFWVKYWALEGAGTVSFWECKPAPLFFCSVYEGRLEKCIGWPRSCAMPSSHLPRTPCDKFVYDFSVRFLGHRIGGYGLRHNVFTLSTGIVRFLLRDLGGNPG